MNCIGLVQYAQGLLLSFNLFPHCIKVIRRNLLSNGQSLNVRSGHCVLHFFAQIHKAFSCCQWCLVQVAQFTCKYCALVGSVLHLFLASPDRFRSFSAALLPILLLERKDLAVNVFLGEPFHVIRCLLELGRGLPVTLVMVAGLNVAPALGGLFLPCGFSGVKAMIPVAGLDCMSRLSNHFHSVGRHLGNSAQTGAMRVILSNLGPARGGGVYPTGRPA